MPLVRCVYHGVGGSGGRQGTKHEYAARVQPVAFPNFALLCGNKTCVEPGWIWLNQEELVAYRQGERVFKPNTATLRIQASDHIELLT